MRHTAIFQSAMLLALAALGVSAATAQTDFSFAAGVDSTGWAQAQSNADGHVLIESPQYPHGLWLHLVDEAGDALTNIQVEYQGRPDSLVAIRCVNPAGSVQETLVWSRPGGSPLRLTLKPEEASDLPAGLAAIDWQIDPNADILLVPEQETRLEGWEAVAAFLRARWQGQTGRVAIQLYANTSFAVELDHLETIETLVAHLQQTNQPASAPFGETTPYEAQMFVEVRIFAGILGLQEGLILSISLFKDAALEAALRQALGRPQGHLTSEAIISLTKFNLLGTYAVQSLVGLEHFTALQWLSLRNNQIAEVGPLASLNNLYRLDLTNNQIAEVMPLAGLTSLEYLALTHNQIAEVGPLANLNNLQTLHLQNNQIAEVGPLANLNNLNRLDLIRNQIAEVGPLANLNNLQSLHLGSNQIAEVGPLANLNNLNNLSLTDNQIAEVGPLANLNNLNNLSLTDNQIAEVGPLANLNNLKWLALDHNQIAEVGPLASLTNLQSLRLRGNQIIDVGPLAGLTNLNRLDLTSNQIEDLAPLIANPGLSVGDGIELTGNPLSYKALKEQIPALQARGVHIKY